MHLSKLFNGKYLLQNLKKSKMTLAMFFILVPIFTSLIIIGSEHYTFEFVSLASINIMGMYVIPFIFSICLFGYVFRKNSVDFMGSMPISRRAIFITNTIGGIAIILLLQVVTFFLTLLISSLTEGIVFASMAWDILLYQTVAYIFVFVVANLAMSLSGNLITQIAVTMLITFLVPFSSWFVQMASDNMAGSREYELKNQEISVMEVEKVESYTAPFYMANGEYGYNQASMIKMLVLSVIYFALGFYAFQKRKMEIAGESFENKYVHFAVKGLTLVPFVAVLKAVAELDTLALSSIIVAIIVVYYLIFDLITSKRMKFWENMAGVTLSIVAIYGVFSVAISINERIERTVDLDSIRLVNVNVEDAYYTQIKDTKAIQDTIIAFARAERGYSYYHNPRVRIDLTMVSNTGTQYKRYMWIDDKTLTTLLDDSYQNVKLGQGTVITNSYMKLTKKENEAMLKSINASMQEMSLQDVIRTRNSEISYPEVVLNQYQKHQLMEMSFPLILSQDAQKIFMNAANRYAVKYITSGGRTNSDYVINSFHKWDDETREKVYFAVSREEAQAAIEEFIMTHQEEVPESLEKSVSITNYRFQFYTEQVEELLQVIDRIVESHPEEFQKWQEESEGRWYYDEDELEYLKGYYPEPISWEETIDEEVDNGTEKTNTIEIDTMISGETI